MTTHADMPPFASVDAAQPVLDAMYDDVKALRDKHGIHHLLVLACPVCRTADGDGVFTAQAALQYGSEPELLLQVACLYGRLRDAHSRELERALASKADMKKVSK